MEHKVMMEFDINGYVVYQPYLKQYSVTNNNGDFSVVETYREIKI